MHITLITILIIISLKVLSILLHMIEKQHVRGDLIPQPYAPEEWCSDYVDKIQRQAKDLSLIYCDSYFTAKGTSIVKGAMLLYRTVDGDALVDVVTMRFGIIKLKRVEIQTRFEDGTSLVTSDGIVTPDCTGVIEKNTVSGSPLSEILSFHKQRVAEINKTQCKIETASAFSVYEQIEYERGERMVSAGYAKWTNAEQKSFRLTLQGVIAMKKANKENMKKLLSGSPKAQEAERPDGVFRTKNEYEKSKAKQLIMSPLTLAQLQKYGVTEGKLRKLEYFFYTNKEDRAIALLEDLEKKDYQGSFDRSADKKSEFIINGWTTKISMTEESVLEWTESMCDLGRKHDCEFDGWGTPIQ